MKKGLSLLGLIFALATFTSQAQIYQMYSQGFEDGTPQTYSVTNNTQLQTSVSTGGSKAIRLMSVGTGQVGTNDVILTLDTIDFSINAQFNYYVLEFQHIAFVTPNAMHSATECCIIEAKRPGDSRFFQLSSTHYDMTDGGSEDFQQMGSFSRESYPADWGSGNAPNNMMWKRERFNLEQLFQGVAPVNRQLIIRFVMRPRQTSPAANLTEGWFIDDIVVRASSQQMIAPKIEMLAFPDMLDYPSSRGARVVANVTTAALQGINGDSVFVEYTVGAANNPPVNRAYMHRVGGTSRFEGRIPFYGYDTLISYHLVVRDSTVNNNTSYYPSSAEGRNVFRCVRGRTNSTMPDNTDWQNQTILPFPALGDNRSEFIYDQATMQSLGFGPGAITKFRYALTGNNAVVRRQRLQIRMANMPTTLSRVMPGETGSLSYTSTAMQVVYDSAFVIDQAGPNSYKTVQLQDTFFYAGNDIAVQIMYHNSSDPIAVSTKQITTPANKVSIYSMYAESVLDLNPFSNLDNYLVGSGYNRRPWMQFYAYSNLPLIYDCGVSAMAYPSDSQASRVGTDSVVVWLKNFGVSPMHAVGISYSIDNGAPVHYNWTGNLAGGDSVRVLMSTTQNFTLGYHTIRAWVDDSITVDSNLYRDHEPYNDTTYTPFVSCAGPYSGTLTIGPNASYDFLTLERCLYSLSRCGISAPVTIKVPAGSYDCTSFPYIPGTSATNYVLFEPATATAQVTFRRPTATSFQRTPSLVDMTDAQSIRFRNIRFANGRTQPTSSNVLVLLGPNSSNCQFLNCTFVDSSTIAPTASLISTGYADSVLIEGCTFYGGQVGIDLIGTAPDTRATGNVVRYNNLANQVNTAISVVNQNHVIVDSNMLNNVQTNASYVLLCQYVYDNSYITRNKVYSTKGASCIGVSDMYGTATSYSYVANNMLVSLDDGTTNQLTTPLNIIKGAYLQVAFNSVRMKAPSRVNVAAATLGGGVINHCYFRNNVVATFDTVNYAFAYIPSLNSTGNVIDHNCYYATSGILNKMSGTAYSNLTNWTRALPMDVGSVVGNPLFTNSSISLVDLRSFNPLLRHVGTPVPGITIDLFGSPRSTTAPSLGAYEVEPLTIDFAPEEMLQPFDNYCGAPATIPIEVCLRNSGTQAYTPSAAHPVTVYVYVEGAANAQTFIMNRPCPADDTVHFLSNVTLSLPSGANNSDATYHITWWVSCNLDPDNLNDTATHTVESRYAPAAPSPITQNVSYGNTVTITPTNGINTWPVNYYTSASSNGRQQRSGIYWYNNLADTAAFYYGNSYTTQPMHMNDTFYISQKRNLPLVKITEVQVNISNQSVGRTSPVPSWMNAQTVFAIELTNCGDYPADLLGDSIVVLKSNAAAKIWVLPHVVIQPGASLVLQYKVDANPSDSSRTIYCPSASLLVPAWTDNFAIIYRDGHGIADAVPFNNVISASSTQTIRWNNQNVPSAVWQGSAINMGTPGAGVPIPAGVYRTGWPTNSPTSTPVASATLWQVADAEHPMHIGTAKPHLVLYEDNGCNGARSMVVLNVTNVPTTDVSLEVPVVDTGCNLSTAETVSVVVRNYGSQNSGPVTINYSLNGSNTAVCTNTISQGIPARGYVTHTFTTPINMHLTTDSVFHVKVWVNSISTDVSHSNDTSHGYFLSRYTPNPPSVLSPVHINYAQTATLNLTSPLTNAAAVWFDPDSQVVDTTTIGTYTTPRLYYNQTYYVAAVATSDVPNTHVGTLANATNNNYPSPYNPKTRYVREQYLVTAEQMRAAGHFGGTISSLSFYLESLGSGVSSFTFSNFTIKMGTTTASVFANTNFVSGLTEVYHSSNLTLNASNLGWVHHQFSTPYVWDGVSNLIVEVVHELNQAGISAGANTRFTAQANTVITKQHATTSQANVASGTKGGNRPDMKFGFLEIAGCESYMTPINIVVDNLPPYDGNFHWDPALDTAVIASCASTQFNAMIENSGSNPLFAYSINYQVDGGSWNTISGNVNGLTTGHTAVVPLLSQHLTPGRHTVKAILQVAGDTVPANDTILRTFNVRFCAGTYTVGATAGNDYATLQTVLDTLRNAGVAGSVVFHVDPGVYTIQPRIGRITGTEYNTRVTFMTNPSATTPAKITYVPTLANNYVMHLNGAADMVFDNFYFYGNYTSTNAGQQYANVIQMTNCDNITIRNSTIRCKARTNVTNISNLILLGDGNTFITIDSCVLDSGYYQVTTMASTTTGHHLTVSNCQMTNFAFRAVNVRNMDTVQILKDSISSQMTTNSKPLTGISIANAINVAVRKNFILLLDNYTGGKRGIQLMNCRGTNVDRVTVYNNMISLKGTGVAGQASTGILLDSTCSYVSVYFNSVRLNAGQRQIATKAFSVERSARTYVLNNIFMNESQGYAYYVAIDTCVSLSNYNVYWSSSDSADNRKFAYWAAECPYIDSLRNFSNPGSSRMNEVASLEDEPPFWGERDLTLRLACYAGLAQYNADVPDDIFDSIRPQIPTPTIGCFEFLRVMHDVAINKITEPRMPSIVTGNNAEVFNIETDSILVRVKFYNNGMAPENNVYWYATIDGTTPLVRSVNRNISLPLRTHVEDSVKLESPFGVVDSQRVVVYLVLGGGNADVHPENNTDTANLFIYPAYDLQVQSIAIINNTPAGCRMYAVPITYTLKNAGKKDFPGDFYFDLGYYAYCSNPATLSLPNLPCTNYETVSLGEGNDLPVNTTREITISTPYQPNLYPTGTLTDIVARVRGWVSYEHDVKPLNDTSTYINVNSYHTPDAPIGHDTMVDYGTYANLYATQGEQLKIRWHNDTSGTGFFWGPNALAASWHWESRQTWDYCPPYYHDTTFWLSCLSNRQCTSYYSPITVSINPPLNYDVSITEVLSPRGASRYNSHPNGRVYNEVDSVVLRVSNFGSQPISNIPIGFSFMHNNGRTIYLTAEDTVRATIPGRIGDNVSYYDFKFPDSVMLQLPGNPLAAATYKLNAWVNHPSDQQHNNDTLGTIHSFKVIPETTYDSVRLFAPESDGGFDITHVTFNQLDHEMPEMFGYHHRSFGAYNPNSAEVPTLRMVRGTQDTLFIEVANNFDEKDSSTGAMLFVAIDYDRDGHYGDQTFYSYGTREVLTYQPSFTGDGNFFTKVRSRRRHAIPLTIPDYAQYGYMRMLVVVDADTLTPHTHTFPGTDPDVYSITNGSVQDFLLFIQEPGTEDSVDAAISRVSFPREHVLTDTTRNFGVMLANKGCTPITSAHVVAHFMNLDHATQVRTVDWTGELNPGQSELIVFDSVRLHHGTTVFRSYVQVEGDTLNHANDTLYYQYHIFDTIMLTFSDSFDSTIWSSWYTPSGYNVYNKNLFERATPAKTNISGAFSQPAAMVTNATRSITTGTRGNRSVLYSPVINISTIRPDTLSFYLCKHIQGNSKLFLEYTNYDYEWTRLENPEIGHGDTSQVSWYDDPDSLVWHGSSVAGGYELKRISLREMSSGEFPALLQFRFVYEAPYTASNSTNYGDGVAIDNFTMARARRPIDPGVIDITYPTDPRFGETIYPRVAVHNFGTGPVSDFTVAYLPYGSHLPIEAVCHDTIQVDSTIEFTFPYPFIVTADFPDTFQICAFTKHGQDVYHDNDTCCKNFGLAPLTHDMYMYSIISPTDRAVAGDSIDVRVRLRNFGLEEVEECDVTFAFNGEDPVTEHINFRDINQGRPLASTQFYDYTFSHRIKATMGTMTIITWVSYDLDTYPYNDSLERTIVGINSVTDVRATGIMTTERWNDYWIMLVLDNLGARVVNNFRVGAFWDNDTSTLIEDTFYREGGLAGGARAVHIFPAVENRSAPRNYITAFCVVPNDHDHSNDTVWITSTEEQMNSYVDLRPNVVEIEENESDSCRVRIQVENIGTQPSFIELYQYTVEATINGNTIIRTALNDRLDPGQPHRIMFTQKIPKDPNRHYVGSGKITTTTTAIDIDPTNNTTNLIRVFNYFEGVPVVVEEEFTLSQNYPNPFDGSTRIEFFLPYAGSARFVVTDVMGRQVMSRTAQYGSGRHTISFSRDDLPAGIYYYSVEYQGKRLMKKMIVR